MDEQAERIIVEILHRGNDVQIQTKSSGYVILEVEKKIRYRAPSRLGEGREDNQSQAP